MDYVWDQSTKPEWAGPMSRRCDIGDHNRCTGAATPGRYPEWCGCGCGCTAPKRDPAMELKDLLAAVGAAGLLLGTFGPW
jgi:hypothetical protein